MVNYIPKSALIIIVPGNTLPQNYPKQILSKYSHTISFGESIHL
jgi:hypothetical protein